MRMTPLPRRAGRPTLKTAGLAALALLGGTALAQPSPALDRASFSIGAFHADPTFNAAVNTNFGRLDSGDSKSSSVTLPRIKADVLLFDSQGLSFDYYQFKRGYGDSLASNFRTGGGTVTTTGTANLDVKVDFAKLAYKWWFGSGNTVMGVGLGAAYYRVGLDLSASAAVGGSTGSIRQSDSDDAVAPLLELGVRHAISPDLRLFADASGVKKTGGSTRGEIYNAALGVEWFPAKNVGVVLDYGLTDIDLRREDSNNARFRVKLKGPSAFLKVRF
ncbi:hypothetical protein SAMN05720382_103520 [Polaromonas sp. JS666]|nr:hypothetical protein [Polaromonas sp. JS666]SDN13699.1 hypothetical protein SAMN05720382_103520 [Polaromonas sp. JS666]